MPIKGEFSWTEKKDIVKVIVPLKGVSASKVDIFVSGSNLKVNYSPYLIDIFLFREVESHRHKASVKNGVLSISLTKREALLWHQLERETDKQTFRQLKSETLQSHAQQEERLAEQQRDRRVEEERHAVRQQMALDAAERERLEQLQAEEKAAAERDVYEAFAKMQTSNAASKDNKASHNNKSVSFAGETATAALPQKTKEIFPTAPVVAKKEDLDDHDILYGIDEDEEEESEEIDDDMDDARTVPAENKEEELVQEIEQYQEEEEEEEVKYVPPPRQLPQTSSADGKVRISFTPRIFPTPMRESKAAEEEDWIAKNRRHLKHHGALGKYVKKGAGDVSEEDPVWLKAKGDDFCRTGDVRSAINAYSAAIDADEEFVACYANRAVCYLQIQLYSQCKLDCDTALNLLHTQLTSLSVENTNFSQADKLSDKERDALKLMATEVKLFLRRGSALCAMGQFQESYSDYCQALVKFQKLPMHAVSISLTNISSQSIQSDIDRLKLLCSIDSLKKSGDALIAEKQLQSALEKYDEVLQILPIHVSALSNRAGCRLALGDVEGAISDCTTAIEVLRMNDDQAFAGRTEETMKNMLSAILPPPQSDKRKQWLLKTILRKAAALVQLERISDAIEEYRLALQLEPSNAQIRTDHDNLVAHLKEKSTGNKQ